MGTYVSGEDSPASMAFLADTAKSLTSSLISAFDSSRGIEKSFGPSYVNACPFWMRTADGATGGCLSGWKSALTQAQSAARKHGLQARQVVPHRAEEPVEGWWRAIRVSSDSLWPLRRSYSIAAAQKRYCKPLCVSNTDDQSVTTAHRCGRRGRRARAGRRTRRPCP